MVVSPQLKVLCLSSHGTASIVSQCPFILKLVHVRKQDEALHQLQTQSFDVLVAALGTDSDSYLLHSTNSHHQFKSPLLLYACRRCPRMLRIVFSQTASQSPRLKNVCLYCGADVVLSSLQELERAIHVFFYMDPEPIIEEEEEEEEQQQQQQQQQQLQEQPETTTILISQMPMRRRQCREDRLQKLAGGTKTHRVRQSHRWTQQLEELLQGTDRKCFHGRTTPFTVPSSETFEWIDRPTLPIGASTIRMVHISDTHNGHRDIAHLKGDLFVHTGDIVANYHSKTNLLGQLMDFLNWLETKICPNFDMVLFMAGNHDTLLDPHHPKFDLEAYQLIETYVQRHSNKVRYLHDSGIEYRGFSIYASPTCVCRKESQGKRYLSSGFERTEQQRAVLWSRIPSTVDILMTHCAPANVHDVVAGSAHNGSCSLLTEYVYWKNGSTSTNRQRPLLHLFGHYHSGFGIANYQGTILANGSQGNVMSSDPLGGATPLIFDLIR